MKELKENLIPNSFMLGGSTITTEITDGKMGKEVGKFIFPEGKIYLANEYNGYVCSRDYMETSFFHELTHGILDYMGKHELSNDEEFVEGFANMLHQYMKTKK